MDSKENSAPGEVREQIEPVVEETPAPDAVVQEQEPEASDDTETVPESSDEHIAGEPDAGTSAEENPAEISAEELLADSEGESAGDIGESRLKAILEAVVYITDEPLTDRQLADALEAPRDIVKKLLDELVADYEKPEHGLVIREVADGYKMGTKAEHHEAIRAFVRKMRSPLKLSMAALETLAVVAYKQPITAPEIMEIRGVQGAGVLKTLLDRKLITTAGRKQVVGKPILYKTTKDFLVQFGLKNLNELPTLKEFEELARMALSDSETVDMESGDTSERPSAPAEESARSGQEDAAHHAAEDVGDQTSEGEEDQDAQAGGGDEEAVPQTGEPATEEENPRD